VLGLRLFTNRGHSLIARAIKSEIGEKGVVVRDGVPYKDVKVQYMDMPFNSGSIKGFFGRSDDGEKSAIHRLGLIWARSDKSIPRDVETDFAASSDIVGSEDYAVLQKSQTAGTRSLEDKLLAAQKVGCASTNLESNTLTTSRHLMTTAKHLMIAVIKSTSLRRFVKAHQPWKLSAVLSSRVKRAGSRERTRSLDVLSTFRVVILRHRSYFTV
jgi:hypothetical protein